MKISVLHPSRNRAPMAEATITEWLGNSSGLHPIEYILSIDTTDGQIDDYEQVAERHGIRLIIRPNRNLVEACNRAARVATGDLLIMVSDDIGCPPNWDEALALAVQDRSDAAVLVDDGLGARTMALPIVGRAFYQSRGHLLHPGYLHHFSQNDLEAVARRLGKLIDARHLRFLHRHYTAGASAYDATYRNADRSWAQGAHLWRKREVRDFGLRPVTLGDVVTCARLDLDYLSSGMQRHHIPRAFRWLRAKSWVFASIVAQLGKWFKHGRYTAAPSDPSPSFGPDCYLPVDRVQGDVSLLEHVVAPSHIVCLRDCVVDRSRVRVPAGGGRLPAQRIPLAWEYAAFERGSLQLRSLSGFDSWRLRGYLRRFMDSAELVPNLASDGEESVTTFAVERWIHSNFCHVLMAIFELYVAIQLLGRAEPYHLLFLDGHGRSPFDPLWLAILKPVRILRLHDYPGERIRYKKLVLVSSENGSPLWYSNGIAPPGAGDFLSDFIAAVLAAYQIADRPSPDRVLTFVDRRDYPADAQSNGVVSRKVDDLDFTIGLLRRLYPRHRIQVHSFEQMPFEQQIQIVRETDVLCGVHGAALMHLIFMRPGSEVVEFMPPEFMHWNLFSNLAGSRGIRYTRYQARVHRVEANGSQVVSVTDTPA